MLFNSLTFVVFLPIVWALYWGIGRSRRNLQNAFLIVASYVFYGWWDWRFLSLIFLSSLVDFLVGLGLGAARKSRVRRALLGVSLGVNLGALGLFKYFNFFADSLAELLSAVGLRADFVTLQVVLPVGISFYTFQTLSYSIDIYRGKISPTRDAAAFFAFVSFFPQLVAGPIERASHLLGQFLQPRTFSGPLAREGLRLILWGLAKKVVVADSCARAVERVFADPGAFRASELWVAAFLFAVQIYGDFSGYSDIARGVARLFGFDLMLNFRMPYFATSIGDFWHRWHISLSTWFRDYVYIPLGGNRDGDFARLRNVFLTFVVSGLWHGANWTFVAWGALHGFLYVIELGVNGSGSSTREHGAGRMALGWAWTFVAVLVGWVLFRAESLGVAGTYLARMLFTGGFGVPRYDVLEFILALTFLGTEWLRRKEDHVLAMTKWPLPVRWTLYAVLATLVLVFGGDERTFIYFQF